MNDSNGGHYQLLFLFYVGRSEGCRVFLFDFMSFAFIKNEKWWNLNFSWDQRGTTGEGVGSCIVMHFLCLQCKSLTDTSFFNFGINIGYEISKIEFEKGILNREIKLNYRRLIWKIWMICTFFGYRWKWGHVTNYEYMLHDWAKYAKNHQPSHSVSEILWHVPILKTWIGHGQDISN